MCCNTVVWILFGTAGNAVFAPGTKHNVREFMFVQFICSGSRWRFSCSCNWGVFVVLHNRICGMLPFLVFSPRSPGYQQSVQLVQLVVHVSAPSFFALVPSQLSEDPSRTFDSHVSTQYSQLVSMVSHRKPKHPCGENTTVIPPSFIEDTAATGPPTSGDLIRDPHNTVLGHVRNEFLTMMLQEFATGSLELDSFAELRELHVHSRSLKDKHCGLHQNQP